MKAHTEPCYNAVQCKDVKGPQKRMETERK